MDAGYSNTLGFLTQYRGVRYHLKEFNITCPPTNAKELYNLRHSSLRTTIERVFAVLKNRFPILKLPRDYSLTTQRDIVIACCVLHNHIAMYGVGDELLEKIRMAPSNAPGIDPQLRMARDEMTVPRWTRDTWTAFQDSIAEQFVGRL